MACSNSTPNFKKVSPSARFRQVPPPLLLPVYKSCDAYVFRVGEHVHFAKFRSKTCRGKEMFYFKSSRNSEKFTAVKPQSVTDARQILFQSHLAIWRLTVDGVCTACHKMAPWQLKLDARMSYTSFNPFMSNVDIWAQLYSILCQTGLRRHL